MKLLITGAAGFIGFHLTKAFVEKGEDVIGIDNINDYCDVDLKFSRLDENGIDRLSICEQRMVQSKLYPNYRFMKIDICNKDDVFRLFSNERPDVVCHLAAQTGVRYSLINPDVYIQSNITGFCNILEACRHYPVQNLLYASSSSVYGKNKEQPYGIDQQTDHPVSLYAATKKMNELMAHTYSHLYHIPTIGLRFFTVYGPWGRPDMAPFIFAKSIIEGVPLKVYNNGAMSRDFTYVDDVVRSIILLLDAGVSPAQPYQLYNIGGGHPTGLLEFISILEKYLGKVAEKQFLPLQDGDMITTFADVSSLINKISYQPQTSVDEGIQKFVKWYKLFFK